MTAVFYNALINQGADWYINFIYNQPDGTPVNLTGATAALQVRSFPEDTVSVLTLTSEDGGITITPLTGTLEVHATAEQTTLMGAGFYYYDIEITQVGDIVTRLAQGQVEVNAQVTRT